MLRNLIILFSLCGLTAILSCKKDKSCSEDVGEHCEDIQNVKKFFAFKVGSWWLYEEENSGERDSVYVTQYANDPSNYNFDVRMYSTHQDCFYHYWPVWGSTSSQCSEEGTICNRCIKVERSKYKPGDFVHQSTCFIFLPVLNSSDINWNSINENNKVTVVSVLDSYDLPNSIITNRTVVMYEPTTFMEGKQPTNHYFSEDVGLIRKELLDSNQVWNLIDYYIQE